MYFHSRFERDGMLGLGALYWTVPERTFFSLVLDAICFPLNSSLEQSGFPTTSIVVVAFRSPFSTRVSPWITAVRMR